MTDTKTEPKTEPKAKGPANDKGFNQDGERIADVYDPVFGTVAARQAAVEDGTASKKIDAWEKSGSVPVE